MPPSDDWDKEGLEDGDDGDECEDGWGKARRSSAFVSMEDVHALQREKHACRKANTNKQYQPRLQRFLDWCSQVSVLPIPHPERVYKFLAWRRENGQGNAQPINDLSNPLETYRQYVCALEDYSKRLHTFTGTPVYRESLWKHNLLRSVRPVLQKLRVTNAIKTSTDMQARTAHSAALNSDAYTDMCMNANHSTRGKTRTRLYTQLMVKLARQTVSRCDEIKVIRHCDLFLDKPKCPLGPAPVYVLSFVSWQGKTNSTYKAQYATAIRHVDPECCCHLGLAWWLFHLYHVERMAVPAFLDNSAWHPNLLFSRDTDLTEALTSQAVSDQIGKLVDEAADICTKVMHFGRASGSKEMGDNGVPSEAQDQTGRWDTRGSRQRYYQGSFHPQVP